MVHGRRAVAGVVIALGLVVLSSGIAHAQVGYDPAKKLVTLTTVTANSSGQASADVTLPADTTPGYEVIASGFDPADQPRSVLATVTSGAAALGTPAGSVKIVLASATQTVDRNVHVTADGFKPNSPVVFSVRYTLTAVLGEEITRGAESGSSSALPLTGSNVGLLIAAALAILLVGGAILRSSHWIQRGAGSAPED